MPTKQNHINIVVITIAIILLLAALVVILDRFPDLQQSTWIVSLGIFASITSPIAVYEFLIKRSPNQDEIKGKSDSSEIRNGQTLEIAAGQHGTVMQLDQRGQNVPGSQTNIGSVQGHQFSGPIGTVNLPSVTRSAPLAVPWQIPLPPNDFTGRSEDLGKILEDLERGATITGLRGMGGIGKTALALVLAKRLKDKFPDGQLFINLKDIGESEEPLTPADAMAQVIRAYFGSDAQMPENEAELAGLYRSVLAGKRVLLLLDNAASREQIDPLLPPEGCCVLVTSRKKFALPGLKPWDLDPLSTGDARELLLAIAPRIGSHADKLAELCAFLPITLKAAAYLLAETTDLTPAKYVEELSDERTRLKQLGRAGVDLDAEACFMLSYRRLPAETARIFRLLSVFPFDFDAQAEEAVCQDEGHLRLSELVRWNLIEYLKTSQEDEGRYHLHDLVRLFAAGRLEVEGDEVARNDAQQHHAAYYKKLLSAADSLYLEGGSSIQAGLEHFDREVVNIKAGQAWAEENLEGNSSAAELCASYPDAGIYVLDLRLHPLQKIAWLERGVEAARRLKDRAMEGCHLGNLGLAYVDLSETSKAIDYHEHALAITREIGDRRNEGAWLNNLGLDYADLGDARKAIGYYEQSLSIAREIDDRRGEGRTLVNLSNAYVDLGETRTAIEYYEHALKITREIGDRGGEGTILWNMSFALDQLGKRAQAIECAKAALKIKEEIEDPGADNVRRKLQEWESQQQKQ